MRGRRPRPLDECATQERGCCGEGRGPQRQRRIRVAQEPRNGKPVPVDVRACRLPPVSEAGTRQARGRPYRRAEEADLPRAVRRCSARRSTPTWSRPASPRSRSDDRQSPVYRHLLRHDAERFWVAEAVVEELTGGGAARSASAAARSSAGGAGCCGATGGSSAASSCCRRRRAWASAARLFDLAATGAPPGAVRATVTDSLQPVSNTLYARRGLLPREVLVGFDGQPRAELRAAAARHARAGAAHARRRSRSSARSTRRRAASTAAVDHGFYLTRRRPVRLALPPRTAGRSATSMVRQDGWVGPAAAVREPDMETVTASGIADLRRRGVAEKVRAGVHRPLRGRAARVLGGRSGVLRHARPAPRLAAVRPPRPLRRRELRDVLSAARPSRVAPAIPAPRDTVR